MTSRAVAIALTVLGAAGLYFGDQQEAMLSGGLAAGVALVAIWLVAGRTRRVLAGVSVVAWIASLWLVASAAGLPFVVAGGLGAVVIWVKGPAWPGFGARFERNAGAGDTTPKQMWESLDRGEDPTDLPDP